MTELLGRNATVLKIATELENWNEKKLKNKNAGLYICTGWIIIPFNKKFVIKILINTPMAKNTQTKISRQKTIFELIPKDQVDLQSHSPEHPNMFRFIDLFCGIGGFRLAFERAGGQCVFSSDWDKYSRITYAANHGESPHGDINSVPVQEIPKFDILCAGFPCQPFSLAGVSKKNSLGRKHGFDDAKQGNLFFSIADILDHHKPDGFLLENVKNLKSHDKGRTFNVIYETLTKDLGYQLHYKVIDARSVVPQHRERIFLVGFREPHYFDFPEFPTNGPKLSSILDPKIDNKFTLSDNLWNYLQEYARKHKAAGNGFGFGLVTKNDTSRTLSARYHKDGSEILVFQGPGKNPRRLSPRECCLLMGYPADFQIPVSDTQAYRQFGNSVVVPVVEKIAKAMIQTLYNNSGLPSGAKTKSRRSLKSNAS